MSDRGYLVVLGAACVVIVASLIAIVGRSEEEFERERLTGPPLVALRTAGAAASVANPPVDKAEPASPPERIVVPALGVVAPVIRLGLLSNGELDVPKNYSEAGWWSGGFEPGQSGPAVIVGHIDSESGPAVFANLIELQRGDAVQVVRADGRVVEFEVQRVEEHDKKNFPTHQVYNETAEPELRLLTCGGEFDEEANHYKRNVVVWASQAAA